MYPAPAACWSPSSLLPVLCHPLPIYLTLFLRGKWPQEHIQLDRDVLQERRWWSVETVSNWFAKMNLIELTLESYLLDIMAAVNDSF